jgi:hypothetical protein
MSSFIRSFIYGDPVAAVSTIEQATQELNKKPALAHVQTACGAANTVLKNADRLDARTLESVFGNLKTIQEIVNDRIVKKAARKGTPPKSVTELQAQVDTAVSLTEKAIQKKYKESKSITA